MRGEILRHILVGRGSGFPIYVLADPGKKCIIQENNYKKGTKDNKKSFCKCGFKMRSEHGVSPGFWNIPK